MKLVSNDHLIVLENVKGSSAAISDILKLLTLE